MAVRLLWEQVARVRFSALRKIKKYTPRKVKEKKLAGVVKWRGG